MKDLLSKPRLEISLYSSQCSREGRTTKSCDSCWGQGWGMHRPPLPSLSVARRRSHSEYLVSEQTASTRSSKPRGLVTVCQGRRRRGKMKVSLLRTPVPQAQAFLPLTGARRRPALVRGRREAAARPALSAPQARSLFTAH